jgi:hypothetical protein
MYLPARSQRIVNREIIARKRHDIINWMGGNLSGGERCKIESDPNGLALQITITGSSRGGELLLRMHDDVLRGFEVNPLLKDGAWTTWLGYVDYYPTTGHYVTSRAVRA